MFRPVGVVLAGGAGKRMGGPKGAFVFRGKTLVQRAVEALQPVCDRVLVSVAAGAAPPLSLATTIEDPPPAGRGPLAGLAAAFAETGDADLMVLACDYPFVEASFCRAIVAAAQFGPEVDVAFPVDASGRDHPLVAFWRRTAEAAITAALCRGELSVRGVLGVVRVRRLAAHDFSVREIDPFLENWNTPADTPRGGFGP